MRTLILIRDWESSLSVVLQAVPPFPRPFSSHNPRQEFGLSGLHEAFLGPPNLSEFCISAK